MSGESEQTPRVSIRFTGCPLVDGRGCTSNPSLVKTQAEIRNLKPRKYLGERVVVESEEPLAFDEGPVERPVHHSDRHQPVGIWDVGVKLWAVFLCCRELCFVVVWCGVVWCGGWVPSNARYQLVQIRPNGRAVSRSDNHSHRLRDAPEVFRRIYHPLNSLRLAVLRP